MFGLQFTAVTGHTVKCESHCRVSTNRGPGPLCTCHEALSLAAHYNWGPGPLCACHEALSLAPHYCRADKHMDMLQPQDRQHNIPCLIQTQCWVPTYVYPIPCNAHQTILQETVLFWIQTVGTTSSDKSLATLSASCSGHFAPHKTGPLYLWGNLDGPQDQSIYGNWGGDVGLPGIKSQLSSWQRTTFLAKPFCIQPICSKLYWPCKFTMDLLTSWSKGLLEKLTGSQLVKKFPTFYGTQRFITSFTKACHLSLS